MINRLYIIVIFMIIASCNDSPNTLTPLSSDATILAFGDSLTYGTGAGKNQAYPSVLEELSSIKVINAGVPGEISSNGLERLPILLDEYNPNLLILIHGGNDILRKKSLSTLKHNLLTMLTEAQKREIQTVMLGVPKPGIFLKSAELYKELAEETNIPIELSLLPEILGDNSLKSDVAHPNAKGYQILAEGIYNFLKQLGAIEN